MAGVDGGPRSAERGVRCGPLLFLGTRGRPRGGGGRQAGRVGRIGGRGDMPDAGSVSRLGLRVAEEGGGRGGGKSHEEIGGECEGDGGDRGAGKLPTERKGAVGKPFVLSEGLPPVPHKLVARIFRGEFVDMAELLHDNLEAQRRSSSIPANNSSLGYNPARARREVPDLLSWVQCFGIYM